MKSKILIVEDEERMRRLLELVLKPAGYELILAKWPMPDARALDPEAGEIIQGLAISMESTAMRVPHRSSSPVG